MSAKYNAYRVLFSGWLVQRSSLSVGGNTPHELVDDPLCRDGEGRFTLHGRGLAGALVATARKLYGELPADITLPLRPHQKTGSARARHRSLWRLHNAHVAHLIPEPRQGVGILHSTGAAAPGVLFDVETLPRGTRWFFLLEVSLTPPGGDLAAALAAAALLEWQAGRCWLGRAVARGMGWCQLDGLCAHVLDERHVPLWPGSLTELSLEEKLKVIGQGKDAARIIPARQFQQEFRIPKPQAIWHYLRVTGSIPLGMRRDEEGDAWGLDGLSVGGHGSGVVGMEWSGSHFLAPKGMDLHALADNFLPDHTIVMTRALDGSGMEPFIPGSGLRGPLRHEASRLLRGKGRTDIEVRDPNRAENQRRNQAEAKDAPPDPIAELFGDVTRSAPLLIRDAYLDDSRWSALWLQNHAADEFASGVFGHAKFDRLALVAGTFRWEMVIEDKGAERVDAHWGLLEPALKRARAGHLGVGGAQWRGWGWPAWTYAAEKAVAAGEWWEEDLGQALVWPPAPEARPDGKEMAASSPETADNLVPVERPPATIGTPRDATLYTRSGQGEGTVLDRIREALAATDHPWRLMWREAEPAYRENPRLPLPPLVDLATSASLPAEPLREAWLFGNGCGLRVVGLDSGCRWFEYRENAFDGGVSSAVHIPATYPLLPRQDLRRFGLSASTLEGLPAGFTIREYWRGAKMLAWTLHAPAWPDQPPAQAPDQPAIPAGAVAMIRPAGLWQWLCAKFGKQAR